jgi:tetratricopeptide (TPR) repeat protein
MVEVTSAVLTDVPHWGVAHSCFGFASLLAGDRERAVKALERAVEIEGADFPNTHASLGVGLALAGRPDEGIAAIDEAVRVSPEDAQRYIWEQYRGAAHFAAGRYQEARDASLFALSFNANDYTNTRANAYQTLAASLAQLGELKEARSALEEAVRLRPALTLDVAAVHTAASSADQRERYLEGLRLAGLGEHGLVEVGPVSR